MLLSATLTATDTVSVLSILKKDKFPKVHTIIFGEGILNDAVAIIIFKVSSNIVNFESQSELLSLYGIGRLIVSFIGIFLISATTGIVLGFIFIQLTRYVSIERHQKLQLEISFILCLALLSYYLAEIYECSGIVSLFCFIVTATGKSNGFLSSETKVNVDIILGISSLLAETASFLYLGYESVNIFSGGHLIGSLVL